MQAEDFIEYLYLTGKYISVLLCLIISWKLKKPPPPRQKTLQFSNLSSFLPTSFSTSCAGPGKQRSTAHTKLLEQLHKVFSQQFSYHLPPPNQLMLFSQKDYRLPGNSKDPFARRWAPFFECPQDVLLNAKAKPISSWALILMWSATENPSNLIVYSPLPPLHTCCYGILLFSIKPFWSPSR